MDESPELGGVAQAATEGSPWPQPWTLLDRGHQVSRLWATPCGSQGLAVWPLPLWHLGKPLLPARCASGPRPLLPPPWAYRVAVAPGRCSGDCSLWRGAGLAALGRPTWVRGHGLGLQRLSRQAAGSALHSPCHSHHSVFGVPVSTALCSSASAPTPVLVGAKAPGGSSCPGLTTHLLAQRPWGPSYALPTSSPWGPSHALSPGSAPPPPHMTRCT